MIYSKNFNNYQLIDAGDGEKLESWNGIILRRPDPLAIWPKLKPALWNNAKAIYHRSKNGGGYWEFKEKLPEKWQIEYQDLKFKVSPTNFKHTGIFPEQAANWDYVKEKINNNSNIKVLNLFAYTGVLTSVLASLHLEEIVHVDASKGMIEWAKENRDLNNLENERIRFIVDDCLKFMQRENRRNRKYDAIIMDPPSYGRGPNNELFKFEEQINPLISEALKLLSPTPLFLIINTYTTGYSSTVIKNVLQKHLDDYSLKGKIVSDELGIKIKDSDYYLPCGYTTRWEND